VSDSVGIGRLYRIGVARFFSVDNLDNQMTAADLEALRASLAELEGPARAAIAEEIKTARGFGDLKENAEYHEAKNAQARLETKIIQMRHRLMDARVVEVAGGDVVGFGSTVEVEDEATGKRVTYTIVAVHEASAPEGRLSAESPVAAALSGLKVGETAVVPAPRGERRLKVLSVS
jgi:transcription elongation factor GreA